MRRAFEPGDKVQWPLTQVPAQEGQTSTLTVEDAIAMRHKSGKYYIKYLYEDLADRLIEDMHKNVDEKFDNFVTIVGNEGSGKSTIGYFVAKKFDPDFDMEKSLIYSWPQFIASVSEDPQKVYWLDEGILLASGRDWMRETNKMLMKALMTIRSYCLTIIMIVPKFSNIDQYIRTFRTRY